MSGENVTIPCILDTSEDVECHWLLNSHLRFPITNKYAFSRVARNGDCSIRISNLDMKEDDGDWQCQVYLKKIHIAPAIRVTILMPPEKPKIYYKSNEPEESKIKVEANTTVQIECVSSNGNPNPQLNWLLDGRLIDESKIFKNASTGYIKSTLTYVFDKTMNGNRLVCDSHHQLINEVDSVEMEVVYRPEVRIENDVITVEEGSDLKSVFCKVEANPPATIRWTDTANPKIMFSDREELRLSSISKDQNNKVFECLAENEYGRSDVDSFKLNVLFGPRIVSESENQRIRLGRSVSLNCQVEANPTPTINWYIASILTGEIKKVQTESSDPSILLIKNVTYSDEGVYYCEASNKINDEIKLTRTRDMNLKVFGPPALLKEKEFDEGNLEGRSEIALDFCADPQPTMVYWRASSCRLMLSLQGEENDQPENSCERYAAVLRSIRNQGLKESDQLTNCYRAILIINDTKMEDEISYALVVENAEGKMEHSIKLNVTSPISLLVLIILVLIVFILLIAIGFLLIVALRKRHRGSENMNDDVLKEEAQTISHKSDLENGTSKTDFNQLNLNTSNDSYELVYANLDFANSREQPTEQLFQGNNLNLQQQQQLLQQTQKPIPAMKPNQLKFDLPTANKRIPPQVRPKPQIRPQPRQSNGSTEYAKLTFSKADL